MSSGPFQRWAPQVRSSLVGVAVWCFACFASAASESEAERAELSERLLQQGREAFEGKQYQEAHERLSQAYDLHQSYRTACALGQVELELEMYRDAAEHLDVCISRYPAEDPQQARERVLEGLHTTRQHVAVFEPTVNLVGATLLINGVEVGTTPLDVDLFVQPGLRRVTVRKPGFQDVSEELFFAAGGTTQWTAQLTAKRTESARTHGSASPQVILGLGTTLTAVTLAAGTALAVIAHTEQERASGVLERALEQDECSVRSMDAACEAARRQLDEAASDGALAANVLWVGAGLGVLTVVAHFLVAGSGTDDGSDHGPSALGADVLPVVNSTGVGAAVFGRF